MITARQQEKLINRFETLSEIELDSILGELAEVISRNKMNHLIERHFDVEDLKDENNELSEKVNELEEELERLEFQADDLREIAKLCDKADEIEDFEEGSFDDLKGIIEDIKALT